MNKQNGRKWALLGAWLQVGAVIGLIWTVIGMISSFLNVLPSGTALANEIAKGTNPSPGCIGCVIYWSDSSSCGLIREEISGGMVFLVSTHLWHPNCHELLGRNAYRRFVDYLSILQERRIPRGQKGNSSEDGLKYNFGSTFLGWKGKLR